MSDLPTPPPAPVAYTSGPSGPRASFGRRLVALIVDGALLTVPYGILLVVVERPAAAGLSFVVDLVYFSYFEGSASGQTIGKRALGIRVIDFSSGGPIGFGRGILRYVARILSYVVCLLGYFWMLWDKEKQCWHDKIATTVVVPVQYYPVAHWP